MILWYFVKCSECRQPSVIKEVVDHEKEESHIVDNCECAICGEEMDMRKVKTTTLPILEG